MVDTKPKVESYSVPPSSNGLFGQSFISGAEALLAAQGELLAVGEGVMTGRLHRRR